MILAHEDVGTGSVPVLFVHAFPLDRRMWRPQLEAFGGRAIVPDLRGFGGSPAAEGSIDDYADDLIEVLDARGVERAVVVGLSMGGYIALALVRRHGSRVAALLLADTKAGADNDEARAGRQANIKRARDEGVVAVFDAMRPKVFAPHSQQAHVDELRAIAATQTPSGVVAALAMMRDRPDATRELGRIQMPTTVVVGTHDVVTPPSEAEIMAHAIPGAKRVSIENSGHFSNLEGAAEFNRALADLMSVTRR